MKTDDFGDGGSKVTDHLFAKIEKPDTAEKIVKDFLEIRGDIIMRLVFYILELDMFIIVVGSKRTRMIGECLLLNGDFATDTALGFHDNTFILIGEL